MASTTPLTTTVDDLHESSHDMAFEAKIMSNLELMIKYTTRELKIKMLCTRIENFLIKKVIQQSLLFTNMSIN